MSAREELHRLEDALPEAELHAAARFLEFLKAGAADDPVLRAFLEAPVDDEPTTPEEEQDVAEAWQEHLEGKERDWRDVREELGGD